MQDRRMGVRDQLLWKFRAGAFQSLDGMTFGYCSPKDVGLKGREMRKRKSISMKNI